MTGEPKPLSPGEKVMVRIRPAQGLTPARSPGDAAARLQALARAQRRRLRRRLRGALPTGGPLEGPEIPGYQEAGPWPSRSRSRRTSSAGFGLAARGQQARAADGLHRRRADRLARLRRPARRAVGRAAEPRRLLQGDGRRRHQPRHRPRTGDRALLLPRGVRSTPFGRRPGCRAAHDRDLVPDHRSAATTDVAPISDRDYREVASEHKTYLLEDLWEAFKGRGGVIDISLLDAETTQGALDRLGTRRPRRCSTEPSCWCSPTAPRTTASGPTRPASRPVGDRRRAAPVPRRPGRARTCAGAPRWCCAPAPSATCTTSAWRSAWAPMASVPT